MKPAAALGAPPSIHVTPTCSTPVSSPQSTPVPPQSQAHSSFETRCSTRRISYPTTPGSPASTAGSVESFPTLDLSTTSGLTPDVSRMTVSRRRGRPRKIALPPTYDDFPHDGSAEEKKKWQKRKNTEKWRYKKLMSSEAAEYRENEKRRVTKYVSQRRQGLIDTSQGDSTVYKHVQTEALTPKSKAKEKSRLR